MSNYQIPGLGPALWGGLECTVNRVRDQYFSQMDRNGHAERLQDLERFASLGIRAIRYPVLWERTAPDGPATADWSWFDERLPALRDLGVTPIVGLLHHGSGPRHTSLVDPAFPELLADYAGAVAARYPWVEYYTPVSEPLTTARSARPTARPRWRTWWRFRTNGAGCRGTCCAAWSAPVMHCGITWSAPAPTWTNCCGCATTPARPTSSASITTPPASAGSTTAPTATRRTTTSATTDAPMPTSRRRACWPPRRPVSARCWRKPGRATTCRWR